MVGASPVVGSTTNGNKRWSVLLGCFLGMSVTIPAILLVPMGLYQKSITQEFDWSRTEFSIIISIVSLFNAIAMPLGGYLVDRFGSRRIVAIGAVFGCCGYASLSLATSYTSFLSIIIFTVMMGNLASYPAFMGLAQRWFDRRLGLALAITSTGLGAGVAVFSFIIAESIELHGWRATFVTVGIIALAIGLTNLMVLIRDNKGPIPETERREDTLETDDVAMTLADTLRTGEFWLYTGSFTFIIFSAVATGLHLPALLSDLGATATQIGTIVAVGAGGSLFGRLFTGLLLDRLPVLSVAGIFFLGQGIGFLLLQDGLQWALLAFFLLGAVQGAEIDVMGYIIVRRFGRSAFSRIFGTCFAVTLIGAMTGPVSLAAIYDRTGSYDLGLLVLPLFPAVAFVLLVLATALPRKISPPAPITTT